MFRAVSTQVNLPEQETRILNFWKDREIYVKSLEQRANCEPFVFYEGPPTANGLPHPGHCLTRAIKDVFPRYKTMKGFFCERKAGWDTHGLPVEVEVCKELGIHGKDEIEEFGVEPFIQKCQQSVWRYMQEWEQLTERLGFWIDLSQAYVTYHKRYVESVWWSLKQLYDRGLLYRGHKIVWWWAQGGTALSSGEVGQGYREVADPSVYVKLPLVDEPNTKLVVWTTTPWTLPSNTFAAVGPEITYAVCVDEESNERLVVADALVEKLAEKTKRNWARERTLQGSEMVGWRYVPPTETYYAKHGGQQGKLKTGEREQLHWRVCAADFVTLDSGTGLVHCAPAFGEVDYGLLVDEQDRYAEDSEAKPGMFCAVASDGKFNEEAPDSIRGMWVKDADKVIVRELKEAGHLLLVDQYLHEYPFCWRADNDPLIQYPRESWFIRTTQFRDAMLANNQEINWLPGNIKDGRFGNFLKSNVDWALSRERYWGTPLPIWECESSGKREAVAAYDDLLEKPGVAGQEVWLNAKAANPELVDDLKVHKPYIDAITYDSPFVDGAKMRRVPEVIDCWFDSGAMPFAQWGYPHKGEEEFAKSLPADFISEALDQTRGWFYSQLAISTMLFSTNADSQTPTKDYPHPFRNCIVLGLMLSEWYESKDGKQIFLSESEAKTELGEKNYASKTGKMSKRLRNYRSPQEIFDKHGADALRWYFFANQPPWTSIIYSERAIKESIPEFLLRMWNVLSFFTMYAEIDQFKGPSDIKGDLGNLEPSALENAESYRPIAERTELDRWIISELEDMVDHVTQCMDRYDNYGACQAITTFVDGLSNWYLRRCRDRYWGEQLAHESSDKLDAYWTLYEVLVQLAKTVAPFVPFVAEAMWETLTSGISSQVTESVHLTDYPVTRGALRDIKLEERMRLLREIASLGRSARMDAKIKVRQPLSRVEVVLVSGEHEAWLIEHEDILSKELNVKEIAYSSENSPYIDYQVVPNFKRLGPKVGKLIPACKKALAAADGAALLTELQQAGSIRLELDGQEVTLDDQDIEVRLQAREGWAAAQGKDSVAILSTDLTPELVREGLARDFVRFVQEERKNRDLQRTSRIELLLDTQHNEDVQKAIVDNDAYIRGETLATEISLAPSQQPGSQGSDWVTVSLGEVEVGFTFTVVDA